MGRTCSVPTLACAYQVPRVPCFANTSVRLAVYSARLSSGTAQSSIKLTGLPSPLRLIMMLSPALRTSHRFFCGASSTIETTASGKPKVPISSMSCCSLRVSSPLSSPENSTSKIASGDPTSAVRMVGANAGLVSDNSIMVRSTSSTAVGPSFTMYCAASIAWWNVGKLTTPSTLHLGSGSSASVSDLVNASVPSDPTSRCERLTLPSLVYGRWFWLQKMSRL